MTRQNPPALIEPVNSVRRMTDKRLGVRSDRDVIDQLDELLRVAGDQNREVARLRSMVSAAGVLSMASPNIVTTYSAKGSITATNVTSTTGTTITNSNMTLIAGVRYLVIAVAGLTLNAPAGQSIISVVRIEATGANTDGTRTATVSGERWGMAFDAKEVVGSGSSINIAGRARVTSGTGTVNDAISFGIAFPLGGMVEV